MATTLTLSGSRAVQIEALIQQRPGVTRHRMALALLDLALDTVEEEPERLDAKLVALAVVDTRRARKEQP